MKRRVRTRAHYLATNTRVYTDTSWDTRQDNISLMYRQYYIVHFYTLHYTSWPRAARRHHNLCVRFTLYANTWYLFVFRYRRLVAFHLRILFQRQFAIQNVGTRMHVCRTINVNERVRERKKKHTPSSRVCALSSVSSLSRLVSLWYSRPFFFGAIPRSVWYPVITVGTWSSSSWRFHTLRSAVLQFS